VKQGLRYLLKHYGRQKTVYQIAQLLRVIARDYLQSGEECVAELGKICKRIPREKPGMTDRNRERLRQLDDPKSVRMLLDLPAKLVRKAKRLDQSSRDAAVLVQLAVAIEILLVAPLRRRNLAGLSLDKHLQWSRAGRDGTLHLVIEAAEVKNEQALEFELPRESRELLKLYIEEYLPRLTKSSKTWLIPGRGDNPKVPAVLSKQITDIIFKETGLVIHMHLFRHIAAKLFLDNNPGQYEVIRRLLGHQNMQTTVNFYAGAEGLTAARHYDDTILKLRERRRNDPDEEPE
jgi:integrase